MEELKIQTAIKSKIGSFVHNALEVMFFLVKPHSLGYSENFDKLIYDFISKATLRGTEAMLNCTADNA